MANVVTEVNNQATQQAPDGITGFIQFLANSWGYFVFAIIIIIGGIIIYFILKKMEEERNERDDPIYQAYKNTMRDCELQQDPAKVKRTYKLINLLFMGLPIFKNEHSARILDFKNNVVGYYRGHTHCMDGYLNLRCYKTKIFLFFEDHFLIKCPLYLDIKVNKTDELGNIMKDEDGKKLTTTKVVHLEKNIEYFSNGDIRINMASLQKISYFRYPVYLADSNLMVDYRMELQEDIINIGYDQMMSRVLATGSQMVEKAMLHNPHVKTEQLAPLKTKVEQQADGGQ